jgi:hypothetical protein
MKNVALIFSLLMVVACAPQLDPKAVEAVASLEKFSSEAAEGDCAALKSGFDALHANESLKAISDEGLKARVKAADEKVKPLLDACAAPVPVPVEAAVPAPAEVVPAPAEVVPAL